MRDHFMLCSGKILTHQCHPNVLRCMNKPSRASFAVGDTSVGFLW